MTAPIPGPGAAIAARAFSLGVYETQPVLCACGHVLTNLPVTWTVLQVIPRGRRLPLPIRARHPNGVVLRCRRKGRDCGVFNEIVIA